MAASKSKTETQVLVPEQEGEQKKGDEENPDAPKEETPEKEEKEDNEEKEDQEEPVGCCGKCMLFFKTTVLTSSCLLLLNLANVIVGGILFNKFEADAGVKEEEKVDFNLKFSETTDKFLEQYALYQNTSSHAAKGKILNSSCSMLHEFAKNIEVAYAKDWRLNGTGTRSNEELWSISASIVYCVTVVTTIGYGNMVPRNDLTKALTILYAFIGIPLMLMLISHLGDSLGRGFEWFFYYATCRGERRKRRSKQEKIEKKKREEKRKNDPVRQAAYEKRRTARKKERKAIQVVIPVHVSVSVIGLYLCLGGLLFSDIGIGTWQFIDSLYFSFITLSTIGFGDLVFNEDDQNSDLGISRNVRAGIISVYIIFGLGLMSMCFDHMTLQFKSKIRAIGNYVMKMKQKITSEE